MTDTLARPGQEEADQRVRFTASDVSRMLDAGILDDERRYEVIDEECVGCNLCVSVCPVESCITMEPMLKGTDPRTKQKINSKHANWTTHPNNPNRKDAAG